MCVSNPILEKNCISYTKDKKKEGGKKDLPPVPKVYVFKKTFEMAFLRRTLGIGGFVPPSPLPPLFDPGTPKHSHLECVLYNETMVQVPFE